MAEEQEPNEMAVAVEALCRVSKRGLVTAEQFWAAFDELRFFMVRPSYAGMTLFTGSDGKTAGAVFSTVERLSEFVQADADWVSLPGSDLWGLRVLPRVIMVDPGTEHALVVDARTHPEVEEQDEHLRVVDIHETDHDRFGATIEGVPA